MDYLATADADKPAPAMRQALRILSERRPTKADEIFARFAAENKAARERLEARK